MVYFLLAILFFLPFTSCSQTAISFLSFTKLYLCKTPCSTEALTKSEPTVFLFGTEGEPTGQPASHPIRVSYALAGPPKPSNLPRHAARIYASAPGWSPIPRK